MSDLTPMMEQYYDLKQQYPESILFFRMGDFYEMFEDDARTVSEELDIVLTTRDKGKEDPVPMAGVPYHSVDSYLQRMIKKGYTVAIAEQVEDPSKAKGLVKREVVRVVTPGTVIEEGLLEGSGNNYLMCLYSKNSSDETGYGTAFVDISTGDFYVTQGEDKEDMFSELLRYEPSECILPPSLRDDEDFTSDLKEEIEMMVNEHRSDSFRYETAKEKILDHFGAESLESLGLQDKEMSVRAAGAVLDYLEDTQKRTIDYIKRVRYHSNDNYMTLDATTLKNLEVFQSLREGKKKGSLLNIIDETITAMGSRKLRNWLQKPLLNLDDIEERLDSVEELSNSLFLRDDIRDQIKGMPDIERLISRVVYGNANARDLLSIGNVLKKLAPLKEMLEEAESDKLMKIRERIDPLDDVLSMIDNALVENPPTTVKEGGLIQEGYDDDLDELKKKTREGKEWINSLEGDEKEETGISKLKVGFNKVHGYYLEVPKTQTDKVPERYSRKQTLKNSERYYTEKLKEKEEEIISAEEKMEALEYEIFKNIRKDIGDETERFQKTAEAVAELDALTNFAYIAVRHNYNRPEISMDGRIDIKEGRHPVVEKTINDFVPNDARLDQKKNHYVIITGPNMSGKSTYMRQIALITLLAQIGSFVPAEKAHIGLVDRIFTRVGSLDALTKGQSTFMVEMVELANILHNASEDSLILLDEIGSGTSTFDGLSIAWAVTEYIAGEIGAKTLFATHYHELTELEKSLEGVKNVHVATKEDEGDVTFLRKVREGHTDESYGVHVASLAGVPEPVVKRASEVLSDIEDEHSIKMKSGDGGPRFTQVVFDVEGDGGTEKDSHPVVEKLKELDIDNMTPMEAMNELWKMKKDLGGSEDE